MIKTNLYQSDGKSKVWRREGTAQDPKHTTTCVKHGGGGVMACACMTGEGTGSLIFIDDITADGRSKMNSEVYRHILSAHFMRMPQNSLAGGSFYSKTMIPNILLKPQRSSSKLKNSNTQSEHNWACLSHAEETRAPAPETSMS